ncbi:MAG: nucleotidyl transferase AbiEii/AbiGii toxin family protein [Eggerthellaceae bacterium]|nr:nucleotidyl transferase AbiEii/AbiGii toxin family protein [Eggerthellaceae bacterium]
MSPAYVAKDYFIVLLLGEITGRNPDVVFKGGTSLSKCHNAIDRFSEDVDLGLEAAHATEGMRRRMKGCVVDSVEAVGLAVENLDRTRSKREFNKFIVPLPALGEFPIEPLI